MFPIGVWGRNYNDAAVLGHLLFESFNLRVQKPEKVSFNYLRSSAINKHLTKAWVLAEITKLNVSYDFRFLFLSKTKSTNKHWLFEFNAKLSKTNAFELCPCLGCLGKHRALLPLTKILVLLTTSLRCVHLRIYVVSCSDYFHPLKYFHR